MSMMLEAFSRVWDTVGHDKIPWTWPEAAASLAIDFTPDILKVCNYIGGPLNGRAASGAMHCHSPLTKQVVSYPYCHR